MTANRLPAPPDNIAKEYRRLVEDLEAAAKRLTAALPAGTLHCGPGCADCCIAFSVVALEAAIIAADGLPPRERGENGKERCVLLLQDQCSIYSRRPILCRTQGLPLAYQGDDTGMIEVSACPLNFAGDFVFSEETVLFMDPFNARLAELNAAYCRWAGLDPLERFPLAKLLD